MRTKITAGVLAVLGLSVAAFYLATMPAPAQNAPFGGVYAGNAGQIACYIATGAYLSGCSSLPAGVTSNGNSATAPVVASGFGATGAAVTQNIGTAAFSINVGTSTQTSAGVVTMPAAAHYWICDAHSQTNSATESEDVVSTTTTSITITNYVRTTGVAGVWTASDIVLVKCSSV
jgi:hypothetical protein